MKKISVVASLGIAAVLGGIYYGTSTNQKNDVSLDTNLPLVAITKITAHPSLDKIEQGIVDELAAQKMFVRIQSDNAQGNMVTATQIAQKIAAQNPKLIIPITTPSTQTVYNAVRGKNIPVVFAAVSDPVSAKLVDKTTLKGKGITGVSDLSPLGEQIDLIQKLQPTIKTIGIIYTPGEANSVALLEKFKIIAEKKNLKIIESPCLNTNEVVGATRFLLDKVEAIYIPNDNSVVSALEGLMRTVNKKLPIYTADPDSVERGCLASVALSQYEIGREVGKVAVQVLKGANPSDLAVVIPTQVEVTLNQPLARFLGIKIPNDLVSVHLSE